MRGSILAFIAAIAVGAGVVAVSVAHTTAGNRAVARTQSRRLLHRAVLPADAAVAASDPSVGGRLGFAPFVGAGAAVVDRHRFWHVPGDPQTVADWFRAHPPAGSSQNMAAGTGDSNGFVSTSLGFSFRPIGGVLASRTLAVTVAAARGGGSAVRVDGEAVWLVERPRAERVPAGVTFVAVTGHSLDTHTGKTTTDSPIDVTRAGKVHRIVRLINRLELAQPGVEACPADLGPDVQIRFFAQQGGPVVAEADAEGSGCGFVSFMLRGHSEHALTGGPGLIVHLDKLLGTTL
jgi:hypothetical protein